MHRLAIIALAIIAIPALAFSQGIKVSNEALLEVRRLADDGTVKLAYIAPERVRPGNAILYRITYANTGADQAENVILTSEIPGSLTITEGSAEIAGARTEYSIDGGRTFADRAELFVAGTDGKMRLAEAADLTNVRWTILNPVPGGEISSVSYRAVVN